MPKVPGQSLPLSGIFALDKPSGHVTMKLLNSVNDLLSTSELFVPAEKPSNSRNKRRRRGPMRGNKVKLGQGGTLDPLASGVLVLGINDATKKLGSFLHGTKEYRATGLLGCATDSYDSQGKRVREAPFRHVTREKVEAILQQFRGEIKQLPPIYSALKMDGKALYEYARTGTPLPRPIDERSVTVHNLELTNWSDGSQHSWRAPDAKVSEEELQMFSKLETIIEAANGTTTVRSQDGNPSDGDKSQTENGLKDNTLSDAPAFEIIMTVSSGTYVRTLVHDIGIALGSAAHIVELVRTRQGQFALDPDVVHRVNGEDATDKLYKALPWSLFEEHIFALRDSNGETVDEDANGAELKPWEKAVLDSLID